MIVSELKFGEKDGALQSLTYVLQEGSGKCGIKLWYDSKTLALVKRSISIKDQKAAITENYEEFTVNRDIPDESFKP